jgi:putative ABC transport system permease protein
MGEPGSKRILTFATYHTDRLENELTINTYFGDHAYVDILGMRLIKGRTFDRDLASDSSALVLNEAAADALGISENPIGALVNKKSKVIGVVSDFHWESLRSEIAPTIIALTAPEYKNSQLAFKLQPKAVNSFLTAAEARWKLFNPDEDFRYHFLDDNFGELLAKEATFASSINIFTGLAILISCLGLFGLSAFTAEQRTREIGIRKVLGATVASIVILLNRKFTLLVAIAVVVSIPLSVYIANQWLSNFAYRVELNALMFGIAVASALLLAWITVSYHSIRASSVNPAETLKYE